ncbi:protein of unknown function (DUF4382) [Spongiibacter sp. IMCC21906]|uniref:DUF4382 domain-containing protein n=1 Tax=Spongiibacter sp. IMCC21906 TaxID=1620392 RepID=UPI00062E0820|nr:DUF4382 domain-containing protein [Spongiibacter sp. IMCC21906]AKH67787.1 protein of unknown function (DUF4382) [Spongiibacter sp. IMCC21906]
MKNQILENKTAYCLATGLALTMLTACGGGSSSSSGNDTGRASFAVTDAPVDDVDVVQVSFSRIDLKHADGDLETIEFDEPVVISNLKALTGNASEIIVNDAEVKAGDYNWMRIYVDGGFPDSYVVPSAGSPEEDLFIPGQQNGNGNGNPRFLQLNTGFTVAVGSETDFTIDFVLRKGLTKPENNKDYYLLRPAMRLLNNVEVGTIAGTVEETVLNSPACSLTEGDTVYLYRGDLLAEDSQPDDVYDPGIAEGSEEVMDDGGVRPITTAELAQLEGGGMGFTIGFVRDIPEGYSVAFSCESANDLAASDDDISFTEVIPVQVTAGETSNVSFEEAPVLEETPVEAEATTEA